MKNLFLLISFSLFVSQLTFGQAIWHQYQGPYSGYIESFTSKGDTIYCGTNLSGIFMSVDHGYTWEPITQKMNGNTNSIFIYGSKLFSSGGSGTFYSDNNGKDWNQFPELSNVGPFFIFEDKLFGCGKGIFIYDSITNSWIKKSNNFESDESRSSVRCLSSMGNILFCGTWENGLFKSTDSGENWNKVTISTEFDNKWIEKIINFNDTLMILPVNGSNVCLSVDSGKTWSVTNGINEGLGLGDLTIYKNQVFLAALNGLYKFNSKNIGWDLVCAESFQKLFVSDSIFLVSNYSGIYRWDATIDSLMPSNKGINTAKVSDVVIFNKSLYCATGVGVFYTSDDGLNWNLIQESENIYCNSFKVNDSVLYVGTDHGLFATTIDSNRWYPPSPDLASEVVWDIEIVDTSFYATTNSGLFRSVDKGNSWSRVNNFEYPFMKMVYGNNMLLIASTYGLFQLSGDSLKKIGFDEDYIETVKIIDGNVFVSPSMPERGLFKSIDSCKTWTKYFDLEITDISKRGNSNLYATGYMNIYYSSDAGIHWETWSEEGIPDFWIKCITQSDSCFYAGTIGNSVYKRNYLGLTDCIFDDYEISNDSVSVPPNTTVDSLATNLELAHGASFEIANSHKSAFVTKKYIKNGDILEVTAENGITTKKFILVVDSENKQEESDQMFIFPNPTGNFISISSKFSANANITIYDMQGKLVIHQQNNSGQIDVSQLPRGIYSVRIVDANKKGTQRLVKK